MDQACGAAEGHNPLVAPPWVDPCPHSFWYPWEGLCLPEVAPLDRLTSSCLLQSFLGGEVAQALRMEAWGGVLLVASFDPGAPRWVGESGVNF